MTDHLNFINLVHGINNTRVYKIEKEFFSYTATQSEILAYSTRTISEMAEYLLKKVSDENCQVNLMFGYAKGSLSKNKKKKLNDLLKEENVELKIFIRWITLLLNN